MLGVFNPNFAVSNAGSVSSSVPLTVTVALGNLAAQGGGTVPSKPAALPKRDVITDVEDVAVETRA